VLVRDLDYWKEAVSISAEENGIALTLEQRDALAYDMGMAHEHHGDAFYQPSWSDRFSDLEKEYAAKLKAAKAETEAIRHRAEVAVRQALRIKNGIPISIGDNGEVLAHGGRTEQVQ
jgi:hypothetical protein